MTEDHRTSFPDPRRYLGLLAQNAIPSFHHQLLSLVLNRRCTGRFFVMLAVTTPLQYDYYCFNHLNSRISRFLVVIFTTKLKFLPTFILPILSEVFHEGLALSEARYAIQATDLQ